jgi:polysaccharide export outer membrane protein
MSQTVRVDDIGNTTLSLIGQIHLAGMTTEEGQQFVAEKYKEMDFFVNPQVSLMIQEYSTQGVSVLGEVAKPGVYPVLGNRTLLDLISAAGGLTPTASTDVTIQRRSDGSLVTAKISRDARESLWADVEIQPGDKIIVARAGVVYVLGNVNRPGGYVMDNGGKISLLQAMAMAEGANATAALNSARLIHKTSYGYVESTVPLKKILQGKETDQQMQAEDILYIPNSATKSIFYRGMPGVATAAGSAAIYTAY